MTTPAQDPRELLAKARRRGSRTTHQECDDCWYSCPAHPGYCGNDDSGLCRCGLAEDNAFFTPMADALEAALADRNEALGLLRDAWRSMESNSMRAVTMSAYVHGVEFDPKDACDGKAIAAFLARQQNPKESKP